MDSFSLFVLLIVIVGAAFGWYKGFVRQASQVVAFVMGIAACRILGQPLASMLCGENPSIGDTVLYTIMAYVVLFLVVFVIVWMLGRMMLGVLKSFRIGIVNRLGGALFGVCKWLLALSLLLNMLAAITPKSSLSDSPVYDKVVAFGPWLLGTETAAQIGQAVSKAVKG